MTRVAWSNTTFVGVAKQEGHSYSNLLIEISPRGGDIKGRPLLAAPFSQSAEMHDVSGDEPVSRWEGEGVVCANMSKEVGGLGIPWYAW